jgi:hypothetical protein
MGAHKNRLALTALPIYDFFRVFARIGATIFD